MDKVINKILCYMRIVLVVLSFCLTLYVSLVKMGYLKQSILSVIPLFVPFLGILILLVFNLTLDRANKNIFYNIGSTLAFIAIMIISLRAVFDRNIIYRLGEINVNFFIENEIRIKILLYLMIIGNICLLIKEKRKIHS